MPKLRAVPTAREPITIKEFYRLIPDWQKADLIDGVIYMASPESTENDDIGGFLYSLMRIYARIKGLGRVSGSRFAYKLSERRAPEPDVAFVRTERLHLVHATGMTGAPDIVVEIVSDDSEGRDYVLKKQIYQQARASEYWIIDPQGMNVEFYRLIGGTYQLVPLEEGRIFRSQMLEGFWLDVEWLFALPLPGAYAKLQEILAS